MTAPTTTAPTTTTTTTTSTTSTTADRPALAPVLALRPRDRRAGPGADPHRRRPPDLVVRELTAGETDVLDAVFAGLSDTSRFRRFHGGTPRLAPATRAWLAAVDGDRHLAVAAFAPDGAPIGIARLVGVGPSTAELAIEVVDVWQGRGVGRALLLAVAARGRAAGYRRVTAEILTENRPMLALLRAVLPVTSTRADGPESTLEAELVPAEPAVAVPPAA